MGIESNASFKDLEGCFSALHERSQDFKKSRDNAWNQSPFEQVLESIWGSITFRTNDRRFRELVQSTTNGTEAEFLHQNTEGSNQINSFSRSSNSRKDIIEKDPQSSSSDSNTKRRRLAFSRSMGERKYPFSNYVEIKSIGLFVHRDDLWYEIIRSMFIDVGRLEPGNQSNPSNQNENGSIEVRLSDSVDFGCTGKLETKDPPLSKNHAQANGLQIPHSGFSDEELCFKSEERIGTSTAELQDISFNIGKEDNRIRGIFRGCGLNSGPQLHADDYSILSSNISQSIKHKCPSRGFEGSSMINYDTKGDE